MRQSKPRRRQHAVSEPSGKVKAGLHDIPAAMFNSLPKFLTSPDPDIYLSDNFVVFDLETNTQGDDRSPQPCWPANSIVCGSWCHSLTGEAHNVYGNEMEMGELVKALEEADFIVAHNGKFDMGWLKRAGIDLYKLVLYDTMIAEYCLNGNLKKPLSLDAQHQLRIRIGTTEQLSSGSLHFLGESHKSNCKWPGRQMFRIEN